MQTVPNKTTTDVDAYVETTETTTVSTTATIDTTSTSTSTTATTMTETSTTDDTTATLETVVETEVVEETVGATSDGLDGTQMILIIVLTVMIIGNCVLTAAIAHNTLKGKRKASEEIEDAKLVMQRIKFYTDLPLKAGDILRCRQ